MHITTVIKRDGSVEPFSPDKLNRWAEFATSKGGNWSEIAMDTFKRLPDRCSTNDIHETMIDVCLDKEDIVYSRVAARLLYAQIRKSMKLNLGVHDKMSFKTIMEAMIANNLWDADTLPSYNPLWEEWYADMMQVYLEYWQIKQWEDKYSCKLNGEAVETFHIGALGIALGIYGDSDKARRYANALINGKINLPTPVLNGVRNGDFDSISCCVISSNDTVESIGVADHIAYRMTAKKAGIGIEYTTRSKGDAVKNGRVKHLGKHPIYKMLDRSVKCMTQVTRGGNATVTALVIDPEIENIINWKSQRVDIETRIDKLDFSMGYNDSFVSAVVNDEPWYLFSLADAPELYTLFYTATDEEYREAVKRHLSKPHKEVNARELLKTFLVIRQETGRFYDVNLTRANLHTPFNDPIKLSNLCQEIFLPTKGYESMGDLYTSEVSSGETAFCSLSAINVMKVEDSEYEEIARLALEAVDILIEKAPMMTVSMKNSIMNRRSIGIGITGLSGKMYQNGYDYDGSDESLDFVQSIAERHYFYLLKASQDLVSEGASPVSGIDTNWLPIDTAISKKRVVDLDWESLRGKPRRNSVLVAHMPTESSAVLSGAPNGLYPVRKKVINKKSRKGLVQYICEPFEEDKNLSAWEVKNVDLSKYYSRVQDMTDQGISCDYYVMPSKFPNGKVPISTLLVEWVAHAKLGNKSKYYVNTNDFNGGSVHDTRKLEIEKSVQSESLDEDEDGCESCKL